MATLGITDVPAPTAQRRLADPVRAVTVAALWLLLALFVIYPLLMMLAAGFLEAIPPAGFEVPNPNDELGPDEDPYIEGEEVEDLATGGPELD